MRKVISDKNRLSVIDSSSKIDLDRCKELVCCCKCKYRKSLFGKTKGGDVAYYTQCCIVNHKVGVVTVIHNHGKCENFAAQYTVPIDSIPVVTVADIKPIAI